jgi:hypothetical protein
MLLAALLSVGIVCSGVVAGGATASAAPLSRTGVNMSCGWVTCSAYLGRGLTRSIADKVARYQNTSNAAIAGAFAGACFPAGGWPALACGTAGAVYGGFAIDQFTHARNTNACIRLRFLRPVAGVNTPNGVAIYVDRSKNCKN